ncbi:MAG: DUF4190 domain-containing protein [Armatimonadota bacterium]
MFCPKCGTENENNAYRCVSCQTIIQVEPIPQYVQPMVTAPAEDDPALRILLPVGRSGLAIAAGYAGLFSITLVFGPFAILLSILALKDIKKNPKKLGKGRAIFGLVMGILGTIGLIITQMMLHWAISTVQ